MTMHHVDLELLVLAHGSHRSREQGTCLLEAVAWWAEEPHSDHPACVSPVLAAFGRAWNDVLPADERQQLRRYIPLLPGTAGDPEADGRRAWMATDWLVRVHIPAWLRLAGLDVHADALEGLPELTSVDQVPAIMPALDAACRDAAAVGAAVGDAVGDAARVATWDAARAAVGAAARAAAWAAAWDATRDAFRDAAWAAFRVATWDAAWAAAWAAARAAARDALRSTRDHLIASAHDLYARMIAVRVEVVTA